MFKKLRSLSVIKMEQHSHSGELKQKGEIRLLRIVCIAASTVTAISGPFLWPNLSTHCLNNEPTLDGLAAPMVSARIISSAPALNNLLAILKTVEALTFPS